MSDEIIETALNGSHSKNYNMIFTHNALLNGIVAVVSL